MSEVIEMIVKGKVKGNRRTDLLIFMNCVKTMLYREKLEKQTEGSLILRMNQFFTSIIWNMISLSTLNSRTLEVNINLILHNAFRLGE